MIKLVHNPNCAICFPERNSAAMAWHANTSNDPEADAKNGVDIRDDDGNLIAIVYSADNARRIVDAREHMPELLNQLASLIAENSRLRDEAGTHQQRAIMAEMRAKPEPVVIREAQPFVSRNQFHAHEGPTEGHCTRCGLLWEEHY